MILNDYYEQYKNFSVKLRSVYFKPVLVLLAKWKITPNQITIFRLFFVLPLAYYFYSENIAGIIIAYILFWFLDLFDGALARYLNQASDKGRFLDTLVDNFMYGILMVGTIHLQVAWLWLLGANIVLEYTAQILAIVYKQWGKSSDFFIKAEANLPYFKSVSHIALALYFIGLNYLNFVYYFLDLSLVIVVLYYLYKLMSRLKLKNN